ncbi:hypothetical protein [Nonomuraea turkmeniaca]|uniref:hypothetical protein n=1 Tax=Nonomuraea turkmeniaca TaxID=103838 RepID=UPI0014777727|nr:hypothetical protein [Nonomuraea turkmeniaca]
MPAGRRGVVLVEGGEERPGQGGHLGWCPGQPRWSQSAATPMSAPAVNAAGTSCGVSIDEVASVSRHAEA